MNNMFKLNQSMTVTGLIIFILGMLTFTPEIFFSGVIVMIVSAANGVQQLGTLRVEETTAQAPTSENQSYYAW